MDLHELKAYLENLKGILEKATEQQNRLTDKDFYLLKGKLELTKFILSHIDL